MTHIAHFKTQRTVVESTGNIKQVYIRQISNLHNLRSAVIGSHTHTHTHTHTKYHALHFKENKNKNCYKHDLCNKIK